jgi:uncharacterized protein YlzI (FlbEa/FlbD family)
MTNKDSLLRLTDVYGAPRFINLAHLVSTVEREDRLTLTMSDGKEVAVKEEEARRVIEILTFRAIKDRQSERGLFPVE